jgi:Ni2+-binding GTPase involved in maturation of urease and hydrogenase
VTTRDVRVSPHGTAAEPGARVVQVQKSLMAHNDGVAAANRAAFRASLVLNVVSSPGSGKTALLERTVRDLAGELRLAIVVGDLETDNDALRLHAAGAPSVQIVTGTVCHLEAEMVARAVEQLDLEGSTSSSSRTSATWSARRPGTSARTCGSRCSPSPRARTSR